MHAHTQRVESPRGELQHSAPESLSSRQTQCWQREKTSWSTLPHPPAYPHPFSFPLLHFVLLTLALSLSSFLPGSDRPPYQSYHYTPPPPRPHFTPPLPSTTSPPLLSLSSIVIISLGPEDGPGRFHLQIHLSVICWGVASRFPRSSALSNPALVLLSVCFLSIARLSLPLPPSIRPALKERG